MKSEPWMAMYPTVAAVQSASFETICSWENHLPPPETDVERTVLRRIKARIDAELGQELRKTPEGAKIADSFNELYAEFEKIFGGKRPRL